MDIKSLIFKNIAEDENNEYYLDLTQSSFKSNASNGFKTIYVVTEKTEMRMDLISILFYGSANYIDLICEANNIYNPFSIKAGDVLGIPNDMDDSRLYEIPQDFTVTEIKNVFTDKARMYVQDKNRIEKLKAKGANLKGKVEDPLPPNMLQSGVESKVYKDGVIILGSNLKQS